MSSKAYRILYATRSKHNAGGWATSASASRSCNAAADASISSFVALAALSSAAAGVSALLQSCLLLHQPPPGSGKLGGLRLQLQDRSRSELSCIYFLLSGDLVIMCFTYMVRGHRHLTGQNARA